MADSSIGNLTEKLVAGEGDWLLLEDVDGNAKISRSNLSKVIDHLGSTYTYNPLSANQGRILENNKINYFDIIDNLISTYTYFPLSSYQGKILQDNKLDKSEILDGLTYTDIDKPLSANQGKILNDITLKNTNNQVLLVSDLEGFKVSSSNSGYYELETTNGNGNARNWRIVSEYSGVGYFSILRSTTYGGTPDTTVLNFDNYGYGNFANYFTTPGFTIVDKLINYVSTDTFLIGDSDTSVVSEKAIKGYVDYSTRNYIDGLIMENDSCDTSHDIKVNIGIAKDVNNDALMYLPNALIKKIDVDWVEGNNQGGFPSGLTLTGSTWYHVYLIGKSDLSVIDMGYDTATIDTPINLQADATSFPYYRRIGSVLTDGSANIKQFKQVGDWFYWKDIFIDFSSTISNTVRELKTVSVPFGVDCLAKLFGRLYSSSGANVFIINSPYQSNTAVDYTNGILNNDHMTGQNKGISNLEVLTNKSSQIGIRAELANASGKVGVFAYRDLRGKE